MASSLNGRKQGFLLPLWSIVLRNQDGNTISVLRSQAKDILDRFREGEFVNSGLGLKLGPINNRTIAEGDTLTIKSVCYRGIFDLPSKCESREVSFERYVAEGRRDYISAPLNGRMP